MAEETITEESEMRQQIVSDEALAIAEKYNEKALKAIESYVNLVETTTGVEVNWHALSGGPECDLFFKCETKMVDGGYTPVDRKVRKFIDETKYIRDELEQLMRNAIIAECNTGYSVEQTIDLLKGTVVSIYY